MLRTKYKKPKGDSRDIRKIGKDFCWLCGRTPHMKPVDWHAPFYMQIAHIASGGGSARRTDSIKAVTLLCPLCHDCHVSDSDRLPYKHINGKQYKTIDARHTIFLKLHIDPEHYDPDYLASIWIGIPPDPEPPDICYLNSLGNLQGIFLHDHNSVSTLTPS